MQSKNIVQITLSYFNSYKGMCHSHKMSIFAQPIHHNKYNIPPHGLRKPSYKVHGNIHPDFFWNWQGLEGTRLSCFIIFRSLADLALPYKLAHIFSEASSIEQVLNSFQGLFPTRMTNFHGSMTPIQYLVFEVIIWANDHLPFSSKQATVVSEMRNHFLLL